MKNYERERAFRHVLWTVGNPNGYEPGGFTKSLLEAWGRADYANDARLSQAFPVLGEAIRMMKDLGVESVVKELKESS